MPGQFGSIQCRCQQLVSPPPAPALLTVLRTLTALCGVCHVLLADAVLVCLPVSARAGADPGLEAPTAQYLAAGRRWRHVTGQKPPGKKEAIPHGRVHLSLSGFQGDDDENGTSVHPAHAAGVAHEVVQDCGEFCPHLSNDTTVSVSDVVFLFIRSQVKGRGCSLSKLLCLMSLIGDKRRTRSKVAFLKI